MIAALLILLGLFAYGAIAGVCMTLVQNKYEDEDHRKYTFDGELAAGLAWPVAFIPIYMLACAEVNRNRKAREQKEQEELLKKEGLL
jgi:hypothetical protein